MLRGLLMRQGFMIAEGLICLVVVVIVLFAFRDLWSTPEANELSSLSSNTVGVAGKIQDVIGDRPSYQSIVSSKIFGAAASYIHNPPPVKKPVVPKKVDPVITDSKLPLVLKGTLFAGEGSVFSSASIEVKEKGAGLKSFFIGDEVIDRVFLLKVLKNKVLLDNKRANRQEWLVHVWEVEVASKGKPGGPTTQLATRAQASTRPVGAGRPAGQKLITLDRKTIVKKIEDEYERLASTVDVVEVKDEQGNVKGITTPDIESIGVMKELGFRNGDTLVSINNEQVRGQDQLTSLANKYRNSNVVRVGILRNDQPLNFTYRVR
jgi:type II secretory pathway component PulC